MRYRYLAEVALVVAIVTLMSGQAFNQLLGIKNAGNHHRGDRRSRKLRGYSELTSPKSKA
jgi:hypothetical protein